MKASTCACVCWMGCGAGSGLCSCSILCATEVEAACSESAVCVCVGCGAEAASRSLLRWATMLLDSSAVREALLPLFALLPPLPAWMSCSTVRFTCSPLGGTAGLSLCTAVDGAACLVGVLSTGTTVPVVLLLLPPRVGMMDLTEAGLSTAGELGEAEAVAEAAVEGSGRAEAAVVVPLSCRLLLLDGRTHPLPSTAVLTAASTSSAASAAVASLRHTGHCSNWRGCWRGRH